MRPLDLLSMAAVAGLLSWCVFDLAARASDPYNINSRQRIAPAGGINGHGEPWDVPRSSTKTSPKAQGVAVNLNGIRGNSALASPAFPASFAGSIATRDQNQEVKPAPGRIERPALYPPVQIKTREKRDGHSRVPQVGQWVKVEISTYSKSYHGNGTHSGERYDHYKGHTAATTIIGRRWVLPKGSTWEVEYLGKTITVRVNDTGSTKPRMAPYWLDLNGRAYADLTNGAAPSRFKARMRRVK